MSDDGGDDLAQMIESGSWQESLAILHEQQPEAFLLPEAVSGEVGAGSASVEGPSGAGVVATMQTSAEVVATIHTELDISNASQPLDALLNRIRQGDVSMDRIEADTLLRLRSSVPGDVVPVRRFANKTRAPPCIFFVPPEVTANVVYNEEDWPYKMAANGDGGSKKDSAQTNEPFRSPHNQYEGILKETGSLKPGQNATGTNGQNTPLSISFFRIIKLRDHPEWDDESPRKRSKSVAEGSGGSARSRPDKDESRFVKPAWKLVCVTRRDHKEHDELGTAPQEGVIVPHSSAPNLTVNHLNAMQVVITLPNGKTINVGEALKSLLEQQNGSATENARNSSNGDLAEWMEKLNPNEKMHAGQVVECRAQKISLEITGEPGSVLFVISTAPAETWNLPVDKSSRQNGEAVAMVGRVPVCIVGEVSEAQHNWFLVPSGSNDGKARAVSPAELRTTPGLLAQRIGVVWACLERNKLGEAQVLAFVTAHPTLPSEDRAMILEVATSSSGSSTASSDDELKPRSYQLECIEMAKMENTIVCLPTGKGKTLVATKVIDHYLAGEPGQKVMFIVPTVVLVKQQATYVRVHAKTSPRICELSGQQLDSWDARAWSRCFRDNDVLVGTPAVFATALTTTGLMRLSQFSLMVFDEVHNATGNSPMARIMRDAYQPMSVKRLACPRILGLTASFIAGAVTDLTRQRSELEALMQSRLWCPPLLKMIGDESSSEPFKYIKIAYPLDEDMDDHGPLVEAKIQTLVDAFLATGTRGGVKDVKQRIDHASRVLRQVGMSGFIYFLSESLAYQLEAHASNLAERSEDAACQAKAKGLARDLPRLRAQFKAAAERLSRDRELTSVPFVSAKAKALLDLIESLIVEHRCNEQYKGIVFVEEVALTYPLAHVISHHLRRLRDSAGLAECYCARAVSGSSSMKKSSMEETLAGFKRGDVRILVCTAALEEGVDVSDCEFVIRYSQFKTTKSHIQGSGRARKINAKCFYFDNAPTIEEAKAEELWEAASDETLQLSELQRLEHIDLRHIPGVHPYIPDENAKSSSVTVYNALDILMRYLTKVHGQPVKLTDLQTFGEVPSPSGSGMMQILQKMRYPTPTGWVEVTNADVNRHWAGVSPKDVFDPARAKNLDRTAQELRFFLFCVVVDMHKRALLLTTNEPGHYVVVATRQFIMNAGPPRVGSIGPGFSHDVHLRDVFAPEALLGPSAVPSEPPFPPSPSSNLPTPSTLLVAPQFSSSVKALSQPPGSTSQLSVQTVEPGVNYKGMLNDKAAQIWKVTINTLQYDIEERTGPSHAPIFKVKVTLLKLGKQSFVGQAATNRKAADQSAAKVVLDWLEANGY